MTGPLTLLHRLAALLLTMTILALLVWLTIGSYLTAMAGARAENARLAQQIARLQASLTRQSALQAPAPEDEALLMGPPSPDDRSTGSADLAVAELQARLRALAQDSGGRVEQMSIAPSNEDSPFITVRIQLVAAEPDAFAFLSTLETERPILALEALEITAQRDNKAPEPTRKVRLALNVTAALPNGAGQ